MGNLEKSPKQRFGSILCYEAFSEVIRKIATKDGSKLVGIYAYGDFDKGTAGNMSKLVNLGIDPKHVVTKTAQSYFKGSTDIELSLDILETMYTYPHIDAYLLISGDSDLRHVMKRLKLQGKILKLAGFNENTSQFIIEMANEFIPLDEYKSSILRKVTKSEKEQIALTLVNNRYIQIIISEIETLQKRELDFIGLNYLRRKLIDYYHDEITQISDALTDCIDYELINTYQVPNHKDPDHPTTACELNMENIAVQSILTQKNS